MRFYLVTLGCKVNQYESRALREAWLRRGWQESPIPEGADLLVLNSCAVTGAAVADVRGAVRRLHRVAPQGAIVITGCAAEVLADEMAKLPGVTAVIGQSRKEELLRDDWAGEAPLAAPEDPGSAAALFPAFALSGADRSRALLKVQDGCSHRCAYCVVPLARGEPRSRSFAASLAEAERLLAAGFREIVISGVNLRHYGRELTGPARDFWDLLRHLDQRLGPAWAGRARLRISSLDPGQLGQKALDTLGESRMISPHLHLSLQSGSPSVLARMRRGHYTPESVTAFCGALRGIWPIFGLGADLLVGFPGESKAEFEESLNLCRSLPLSYAHVFPYSRRPGTAAAAMTGQLPIAEKKARTAALRFLIREKKHFFLHSLLNLPLLRVVFEDRSGQDAFSFRGVNEFYADCRLQAAVVPETRVLSPVVPLRVENAALLVAPGGTGQNISRE
jgi:MiaB/RimO family radical SAM methylthiotransferase